MVALGALGSSEQMRFSFAAIFLCIKGSSNMPMSMNCAVLLQTRQVTGSTPSSLWTLGPHKCAAVHVWVGSRYSVITEDQIAGICWLTIELHEACTSSGWNQRVTQKPKQGMNSKRIIIPVVRKRDPRDFSQQCLHRIDSHSPSNAARSRMSAKTITKARAKNWIIPESNPRFPCTRGRRVIKQICKWKCMTLSPSLWPPRAKRE
jgi:hypothetical protein